ncbi:glutamate receptor 2.7 isoform X1 [Cannabis sativa]|uniref:glutamate receptor 2.7 isoform X1 n=1 Tax=Cannabis sativa TaxID=3483 RepID=UPI0029CA59C5|nr:glutamate receptor 2.7 isoform X1 [Cannabis sativa]
MSSYHFLLSLKVLLVVCLIILRWTIAEEEEQNYGRKLVGVKVGVVVDYESLVGKMGLRCINMSLSHFYSSHPNYTTRLHIHATDSKKHVIGAAAAALDLIKNMGVKAIIGPVKSTHASFVVDLGEKAKVPIISYSSATCSSLGVRSSYFFQVTQNQQISQAKAISSIVEAYGWKQVVPIYINNAYGEAFIPFLNDALEDIDHCCMPYRSIISSSASNDQILKELYKLMTMQTRVFVVHTDISLGTRIFAQAKEIGMMRQGYVWIVTNVMTNYLSSLKSHVIDSMQGVIGIKTYVPETNTLKDFRDRWKKSLRTTSAFYYDNDLVAELNVYGLWAYDSVQALAIAVENAYYNNSNEKETFSLLRNKNVTVTTSSFQIGVSEIGPKLHKALLEVRFKGLTGDFRLVNGKLQYSSTANTTFEITNIVNREEVKRIGFWRHEFGLTKNLETNKKSVNRGVESVVWPGKSSIIPKGWEVSTNRKKLRIGVPVKKGFQEFVGVKYDSVTNNSIVTGFCIDIFEAVMKALPYSVDYDFIPFQIHDGKSSSTYDELIDQVFYRRFDAVVGDTTIRANRSLYVDFTLPYTESGVSFIVPIRDRRRKSAWVFLKPLTLDLWVTSACFFIFIGFVVWILEHRINDDFRGPPSHQISRSFLFSLSTIVFAHKEKIVNNLARFVVIIWLFVVLILTQSYTASLTSHLTVQQLQPTVTGVDQLIKNNETVGYIDGSFVHGILRNLGFSESQLKIYESPEECDQLFSKKKSDGGIAAAFDEFPYTKLLLAKYCSKYTMVEPSFKTGGFGFVFPKGSPLVCDVSRAILTVTEDMTMKNIENKWFGSQTSCPDPNTQISSNRLGLESFWGLFLIVTIASFSALIINVTTFIYEHRQVFLLSTSTIDHDEIEVSIWRRICVVMMRILFNLKDFMSSSTFRKNVISVCGGEDKRAQDHIANVVVADHDHDEGLPECSNVTSPSSSCSNHA